MAFDKKEQSATDEPSSSSNERDVKQQPFGEAEDESPLEEIEDSPVRPENS